MLWPHAMVWIVYIEPIQVLTYCIFFYKLVVFFKKEPFFYLHSGKERRNWITSLENVSIHFGNHDWCISSSNSRSNASY